MSYYSEDSFNAMRRKGRFRGLDWAEMEEEWPEPYDVVAEHKISDPDWEEQARPLLNLKFRRHTRNSFSLRFSRELQLFAHRTTRHLGEGRA